MRRTFCVLFIAVAAAAQPQLTEQERQGVRDALYVGNMREGDLDFPRLPFQDPYRFGIVTRAIQSPLDSADALLALHQGSKAPSAASLLATLMTQVYEEPIGAIQHDPPVSGLDGLPDELRGPILGLANWINSANNEIKRATEGLTPEEKRTLIESLPVIAVEEPLVRFSFVRGQTLGRPEAFELLRKVDLNKIRSAGARLAEAVERTIEALRTTTADVPGTVRARVGGIPIVIGGRGHDRHEDTDAMLTIDLGGDDTFVGRHGAGVGYASVLIDLGGNDTYDAPDLNIGAGVLGIGIAYDESGHDVFRGRSLTFGAGVAGVGVLSKRGGDDSYRSDALSQGFGFFGIGLLVDDAGKDTYDVLLYGQGASRTQGVGWLNDREGSDQYRAGGLVLNSPLFASAHYSFAQGFSMGFRVDTGGVSGGVGLLTDHVGDDFYQGETYQQAASYWFSLGTLYDGGGNDTYSGYHYCQASAMHATAAYLFDMGGDDGYIVKVGAAHAIGHDYGVAFLLDRKGDDTYASRDSTPGIGNANGIGVFIDGDGIDRYFGPPGKGNVARGTGSLGVFVDLNGQDDYRYGLSDGRSTTTDSWGVALDRPTLVADDNGARAQRPPVTPGSEQMPSEAEMTGIYRRATQWNVGTAQDEVADNLDRLVKIGAPALEWMLNNRLAEADRLQIRAFVHVVRALGLEGAQLIGRKAFSATDEELLPLIRIASDANVTDFGSLLPGMLKKPTLRAAAVAAAGTLKAAAAVPELVALCRSEDKLLARAATVALLQIGEMSSLGTAQALLFADDLMTRKAALKLMAKFPQQADSVATSLLQSGNEFQVRIAIELLAELGTVASLDKVGAMLLDPRPGVRIECLLRLNGRCPARFRADYLGLRGDPVPAVRSVAASTDPGNVQ